MHLKKYFAIGCQMMWVGLQQAAQDAEEKNAEPVNLAPIQKVCQPRVPETLISTKKKELGYTKKRFWSELYFRVVFRGWECSHSIRSEILLRY